MRPCSSSILAAAVLLTLAGCAGRSGLPSGAGVGPAPVLPEPQRSLIPTVDIAPAKGWNGAKPTAAQGLDVSALASGLDHPRWLHVLPNGDVLVAESNKPQTPQTKQSGIKAWVMGKVMERAGAGVPSADRITLLRDADGDGVAETRTVFLKNLHSPFGMALVGESLYVANADAIVRFPYQPGATEITAAPHKVAPLPAGLNHHWTKNIIASKDGSKLYATVGSNSNVGENGMENEINRAAILEVDASTGATRLFASGLRNPNGLAWEPQTGALWTVVNERDEIGNDLVPDYLTSVKDGAFYGWPYSYYGQHVDARVKPPRPELVAKAISPDYALGAHVAALGLTFAAGAQLGPAFTNGAFIGQHGSWNRKPLSGYNVIFVPFADGKPNGKPVEVLSGFVDRNGDALGRPVGVAIDKAGSLLVADDVGNVVWRVRPAGR
ncbi:MULTISPECIES: sorbosone dehydrogenase family protein [unclassified Massilia]|uniref:PQQ-dependent sugar dehydrogenase n=1 Tax=unclassified Massilia TaxID=2609279 RepID=UPI0017843E89|nr:MULTISPECIES: sorbosone dehydrogenase family protein [unclassified Massilia]MBD8532911.1 sorbosone dehydrogenase family protein [Massilia sp. CFBP 13647]MBD8676272.1 sorbosone dehydrogenase family protein [Massilia sp. CFBP 13721]